MIRPKKSLGQNFLINPRISDRIVSAAEISESDVILEVGPGTGNLTFKLAQKAKKIIAIEKDSRLMNLLKEKVAHYTNIDIVESDVLKLDIKKIIQNHKYKIVANIPYYITSNFLRVIFEKWPRPELVVLLIQKEVAQRIIAKPPHMNLLALSIQYYSEPEIICHVSKNNFRPVPKVNSTVIKLVPKLVSVDPKFFSLAKAGFSEKRKQLATSLAKKLKIKKELITNSLENIGLKTNIRPENLSIKQWQELEKLLNI